MLLLRIWPKSSVVRSAAVADFLSLETEPGATDATLLVMGNGSLFCLMRDNVVLRLRVATRLAMRDGGGQVVKLATSASHLFEV